MNGNLFDPESRADQIYARFLDFHKDNPQMWELFKRFTFQLIEGGRTRYSVNAIFERIRWHVDIEVKNGAGVKINNDFHPYYARLFLAKNPQHAGFFQLRRRTSATHDPYDDDIEVFNTGPTGNESKLMQQLRDL